MLLIDHTSESPEQSRALMMLPEHSEASFTSVSPFLSITKPISWANKHSLLPESLRTTANLSSVIASHSALAKDHGVGGHGGHGHDA